MRRTRCPAPGMALGAVLSLLAILTLAGGAAAAGPPFPAPVAGQRVYDEAAAFRPATRVRAEAVIAGIEARTGAQVVVYTQLASDSVTAAEAEDDARALMDQWGVGRKGIDDGLVILFDLRQSDPCHGEVQLYAGPGYAGAYLSNSERQSIYEHDMLPLLRNCDLDGALAVALDRIDANATPDHARTLELARQVNAVIALLVAPLLFVLLVGWGLLSWLRHGRDPVYLDDPSIHIPAPPAGLTPAVGALVREGRSSRRAFTTASLDLAARGLISFHAEPAALLVRPRVGIAVGETSPQDPDERLRIERARSRPMDDACGYLRQRLVSMAGGDGFIEPERMPELATAVSGFNDRLEATAVSLGWFAEPPARATNRWVLRGIGVGILGAVALFAGINLPASGAVVVGVALFMAGVALLVLAVSMPARTMPGAMIRAMLEAYRRTLQKTMAQARSMSEVVATSAIPLIESPDDAVVWGVALGLQAEVEDVLQRTSEDLRSGAGTGAGAWLPLWYVAGAGQGATGGPSGWAPGMMSASPIPDFGGMMAAIGTNGTAPGSSGSGGGFGGGGSGGGGGGAGGGF